MSEHLSKDEFVAHLGPIRDDIKEMIALQRAANGRLGKLEGDMPDNLRERLKVVEERSPEKFATGVSAVISGVISGLGVWIGSK